MEEFSSVTHQLKLKSEYFLFRGLGAVRVKETFVKHQIVFFFFESPEVQRIVLSFCEATTCRKIIVRNTSAAPRRKHRFVINCVELK